MFQMGCNHQLDMFFFLLRVDGTRTAIFVAQLRGGGCRLPGRATGFWSNPIDAMELVERRGKIQELW